MKMKYKVKIKVAAVLIMISVMVTQLGFAEIVRTDMDAPDDNIIQYFFGVGAVFKVDNYEDMITAIKKYNLAEMYYGTGLLRVYSDNWNDKSKFNFEKIEDLELDMTNYFPSYSSISDINEYNIENHEGTFLKEMSNITMPMIQEDKVNGRVVVDLVPTLLGEDNTTIRALRAMAADFARAYVTKDMTDEEKIKTVNQYMAKNYKNDRVADKFLSSPSASPTQLVSQGMASSLAYSAMGYLLLDASGIDVICVKSTDGKSGWNMVRLDKDWYHVDFSMNDINDEFNGDSNAGKVSYKYFLKTDAEMKSDLEPTSDSQNAHSWKESAYPDAVAQWSSQDGEINKGIGITADNLKPLIPNKFKNDSTPPSIEGVESYKSYKGPVTVNVMDNGNGSVNAVGLEKSYIIYYTGSADLSLRGTLENTESKTFTKEGVYIIVAYDKNHNISSVPFFIDSTPPTISAEEKGKGKVEYGGLCVDDVTVTPNDNIYSFTQFLRNGEEYTVSSIYKDKSVFKLTEDGSYFIATTDYGGLQAVIELTIDKKPPVITARDALGTKIRNNSYVNTPVHVNIVEQRMAPGYPKVEYGGKTIKYPKDGDFKKPGTYVVKAKDEQGRKATFKFIIDLTMPKLKAVYNGSMPVKSGGCYDSYISYSVSGEGKEPLLKKMTLNGRKLSMKDKGILSKEGVYVLTVRDRAHNTASKTFTIDKTNPLIKVKNSRGWTLPYGSYSKTPVKIRVYEKNIEHKRLFKNEKPFKWPSNGILKEKGNYRIDVKDRAGHRTIFKFHIIQ